MPVGGMDGQAAVGEREGWGSNVQGEKPAVVLVFNAYHNMSPLDACFVNKPPLGWKMLSLLK